ncbi:hypothetical protein RRG08_022059, partial [Elysia crispata]
MVWSTVFSLLILFMKQYSAFPTFSLVEFEYSNTCSDDYLVEPKIKFLRIWSSNENKGFIVAEEDITFIQFEVSGGNSVHSFKGIDGPEFYYTTTDGVSYKGCSGFEPSNGSCLTRKGVRDACS